MRLSAAFAALAVTIDVSISSQGAATGYELLVGGSQKRGQLAGSAAVNDSLTLDDGAGPVAVSLRFYDADGVVATCPRVDVAVTAGRPACRPRFTLTGTQLGYRQFLCELSCEPVVTGGLP